MINLISIYCAYSESNGTAYGMIWRCTFKVDIKIIFFIKYFCSDEQRLNN